MERKTAIRECTIREYDMDYGCMQTVWFYRGDLTFPHVFELVSEHGFIRHSSASFHGARGEMLSYRETTETHTYTKDKLHTE